jgi:hypothetical protein
MQVLLLLLLANNNSKTTLENSTPQDLLYYYLEKNVQNFNAQDLLGYIPTPKKCS